jgi:hypothetical protein
MADFKTGRVSGSVVVMKGVVVNLDDLAQFIAMAKRAAYAGEGKLERHPQRKGYKEHLITIGGWQYRDSYAGYYRAPGEEVVSYKGIPVWRMAYNGGMLRNYWGNVGVTHATFQFLKKALSRVDADRPYRGPARYKEGEYEYRSIDAGNITHFIGSEEIRLRGMIVFVHDYFGGIYVYSDFEI